MTDHEIRAKALELAIKTWALLPQEARDRMMSGTGKDIAQYVIDTSGHFERHIEGPQKG